MKILKTIAGQLRPPLELAQHKAGGSDSVRVSTGFVSREHALDFPTEICSRGRTEEQPPRAVADLDRVSPDSAGRTSRTLLIRAAVLMPVYQAQKKCIQSIESLSCSTVCCTVILVDDGSDPPFAIENTYPNLQIHLIRLDRNNGIVGALNAGLKFALSEGYEFIGRLDAGDFSAKDRIEKQIAFMDSHTNCMLVGSDAEVRDESGAYCFTLQPPRDPRKLAAALHERAWLLHPSIMFRSTVFSSVGLYTDKYPAAEDYELFLRIARRHEIGVVPEPLLTYILCKTSISATRARVQLISRLKIQIRHFQWRLWMSYYGVFRTAGTLLMPTAWKSAWKFRFLYSRIPADIRESINVNMGK